MTTFGDYARYYNLLYRDKDYAGETAFVLEVLKKHDCIPRTILDLGCGTGRHALEMARRGIAVTGVDMSGTMLDMGLEMLEGLNPSDFPTPLPALLQSDARTVRLAKKFDAVVSLFHVMSYQNTEEDALAVIKTAKCHLRPGGLFFFDFWHGPAVLRDPPVRRERVLEDKHSHLQRLAVPEHRLSDNMVVVNYTVSMRNFEGGQISELHEEHVMRYWFLPELRYLVKQTGLRILQEGAWMNENRPGLENWNAWMLVSL